MRPKTYICSITIVCNFLKTIHNYFDEYRMLYFIMKIDFLCCRKSRPFRGDPGEDQSHGKRSVSEKKNGLIFAVLRRFCISVVYLPIKPIKSPRNAEDGLREAIYSSVHYCGLSEPHTRTSSGSSSVPVRSWSREL